jgi:hypothetical protein
MEVLVSDDGCTLCICSTLESGQEESHMLFLKANLDVFAWKSSDMPGILSEGSDGD